MSDLQGVQRIRLEGLHDFEFLLDATTGEPSVEITGIDAEQTSHEVTGATLVIRNTAQQPPRERAVQISGSYVTGANAMPFRSPVKEALRVRYGNPGRPPLRISVNLPAGTPVTIESPSGTISTAAPGAPSERDNSLDDTLRMKVDELLAQAKQERAKGSLSGAIRAHETEEKARKLLERKK